VAEQAAFDLIEALLLGRGPADESDAGLELLLGLEERLLLCHDHGAASLVNEEHPR